MYWSTHLAQQSSYIRQQIQQIVAPTWQISWLCVHFVTNQPLEETHEGAHFVTSLLMLHFFLFDNR